MYTYNLDLSSANQTQNPVTETFELVINSILESETKVPSHNSDLLLNNIYSIITDDNSDLIADLLQPVLDSYTNRELDIVYNWLYSRQETIKELIQQSLSWEELPNFISESFNTDTTNQLEKDLEAIEWFINNLSYQIPQSFQSLNQLSNILTF